MLTLAAGLSTGHKIGLAIVAVCFIGFALTASFLAPRRWPDFPGRHGLSVFVIACFVLFGGMLAAVIVFGRESEVAKAEAPATPGQGATNTAIRVTESEWKVQLPSLPTLKGGTFTFVVHNAGKIPHDLVVTGPNVTSGNRTPLIQPGKDTKLRVTLSTGTYTLYCAVPGHRQLGMVARLTIG